MVIEIAELLTLDRVMCRPKVSSKKRALEWLSERLASGTNVVTQFEVFESLFDRERLGSTGLGHNVAIPHGRIKGLVEPIVACLHLKQGVDYDAIDGRPVTFIFALLVPDESVNEYLTLLAKLAEMFNDEVLCVELRAASSEQEVFSLLASWQPASRECSA